MEVGDKVKVMARNPEDGDGCHEFELGGVGQITAQMEDYFKVQGVDHAWGCSANELEVVPPSTAITALTRPVSQWGC